MPNSQNPLKITVVSPDVALNREIAWVLTAVGYSVQTTSDRENDALWRRFSESDVLLFDGRGTSSPHDSLLAHDPDNPIYQIVLYDATLPLDFGELFTAGVNDALRIPLSRGELIARIRTAARWLEFERRLRCRSSKSPVPGVMSKKGFLRKLTELARTYDPHASQHTLLLVAIDWYQGIRNKAGEVTSRRLVASAARILKRATEESAITAYLGDGCFACLQLARSPETCRQLAEQFAKDFADRERERDAISRPTLTTALVPWVADTAPTDLLDLAFEVLSEAKQSGGDCVIEQHEYADQLANWRHEVTAGNPFATVEAQDIMDPFPALLMHDADQSDLVEALRRSRVPVCPYIDDQGKLAGIANAADVAAVEIGSDRAADLPMTQPETIAHNATFPDVYEAFSTRNCSTLLVVDDERPLGYITCDGFLSLIEPVDSTTFAIQKDDVDDASDLLVPSSSTGDVRPVANVRETAEAIIGDE